MAFISTKYNIFNTKRIIYYSDINNIWKTINILKWVYQVIIGLCIIINILINNTWLIEDYLLIYIINYTNNEWEIINMNRGSPLPPPIGGGWGSTSGGEGGGGIPPFESFHAYLAADDKERHTEKVDIDRAFRKYFATAYGTKHYTELGLKGTIEFRMFYNFISADITFLDKTKITIHDEYTFCRYVLAHRYVVSGQPKDYVKLFKRSAREYEKEKLNSPSTTTTRDISIYNLLNHDE